MDRSATLSDATDRCRLLADSGRLPLLALLDQEELTVSELVDVTRLAQSRVSTHLSLLKQAGLVQDRRDGTSSYYSLREDADDPKNAAAARMWRLVKESVQDPLLGQDRERLAATLAKRNGSRSASSWADAVAGRMDRHYSPGRTWETTAWGVIGLANFGDVLDVASGDGVIAGLVASRAKSVTCLDVSERVVEAGQERLDRLKNVRFRHGDMHALPFAAKSFDQALLMNALTYSKSPARVFAELWRVLRPGGALVGATLRRHPHVAVTERYDHVRTGFTPLELKRQLQNAGFTVDLCAVTAREKKPPYFEVITFHARKGPAR